MKKFKNKYKEESTNLYMIIYVGLLKRKSENLQKYD